MSRVARVNKQYYHSVTTTLNYDFQIVFNFVRYFLILSNVQNKRVSFKYKRQIHFLTYLRLTILLETLAPKPNVDVIRSNSGKFGKNNVF